MNSEKVAITNFIGSLYGQMKEIDGHIAAAGSSPKFGGRSNEIKDILVKEIAANSAPQPPAPSKLAQPELIPIPQPELIPMPRPEETPTQQNTNLPQADQNQLEFNFANNNILNDIYNLLYDIKKILAQIKDDIKPPALPEKIKKTRVIKNVESCCVCGSKPKAEKRNNEYRLACTGCGMQANPGKTRAEAVSNWIEENKQK